MINEGNSLAELQAKVLRASPHEKKSETSSPERLTLSFLELLKKNMQSYHLVWNPPMRMHPGVISQLLKQPSPKPYVPKASAKATYVGTSLRDVKLRPGNYSAILDDIT